MKYKCIIFCLLSLILVNLNVSRAESLQYSVQEKSKKDDSLSTTIETISWNFTQDSFKTRETWNNFKDTINCQVKLKDIQRCEIARKDAQDDLTKSKTYMPFSLSLQLKNKLPICQRIFEEDSKNSTQVFSFIKIDMPLDTEARGKEISERLNCLVADKSSRKVEKDAKEESIKKAQEDQSIKENEIRKAEEARLKQEEMAKKKEEAAAKKQEALAKKAEEARLKQEAAAAKQAEISNVKEDDMALKEQEAKIAEEARLRQEEMAKKKEEAAAKKQEALAKKAEEARLKQEEMAKKKEEAAAKKQEALAKKAEEARLKQEAAAAKQAEISNVKEDDMTLKEQEAKIAEEARLKQEVLAKQKEEAAAKKKEGSVNEFDKIYSVLGQLNIKEANPEIITLSKEIEDALSQSIILKPINLSVFDLSTDQAFFDQANLKVKKYGVCKDNVQVCRIMLFGPFYLNNDKANNITYIDLIEKEIK
jgi:hypothetical protein